HRHPLTASGGGGLHAVRPRPTSWPTAAAPRLNHPRNSGSLPTGMLALAHRNKQKGRPVAATISDGKRQVTAADREFGHHRSCSLQRRDRVSLGAQRPTLEAQLI